MAGQQAEELQNKIDEALEKSLKDFAPDEEEVPPCTRRTPLLRRARAGVGARAGLRAGGASRTWCRLKSA